MVIGLTAIIILFGLFINFFEKKLRQKVTKPIIDLTNNIKNPKEFSKTRHQRNDNRQRQVDVRDEEARVNSDGEMSDKELTIIGAKH